MTGAKTRVWTLNSDIRYTYDAMNRLKTVEVHKRNGVELGTPEVTTYDYTKVGSRASISLPNGITTSYQYDSLNRLTTDCKLYLQSAACRSPFGSDGSYSGGDFSDQLCL